MIEYSGAFAMGKDEMGHELWDCLGRKAVKSKRRPLVST